VNPPYPVRQPGIVLRGRVTIDRPRTLICLRTVAVLLTGMVRDETVMTVLVCVPVLLTLLMFVTLHHHLDVSGDVHRHLVTRLLRLPPGMRGVLSLIVTIGQLFVRLYNRVRCARPSKSFVLEVICVFKLLTGLLR